MAGFPVPNWAQMEIAKAAGLSMTVPAIVVDNEVSTTYMDLLTRDRYIVNKKDGRVVVDKEEVWKKKK